MDISKSGNYGMPDTNASMDDWGVWQEKRNMTRGKGVKIIAINDKYRKNWEKIFKRGENADGS